MTENKATSVAIENILDAYPSLQRKEEGDSTTWHYEIFADYRDELSDTSIREILSRKDPWSHFLEKIEEMHSECAWDASTHILNFIIENLEDDQKDEEDEEKLRELLESESLVIFDYPYDHFLKQEVFINIFLDTGDANYDFALNTIVPAWGGESREINDKSSLLWLAQQQGYTKEQLQAYLWSEDHQETDSKFLRSVYQELENCVSRINAVTVLVKLTLRDAIRLQEIVAGKKETIVVGKETMVGLYDPWSGTGSVLAIELEKDVEIPTNLIQSALPDGSYGKYSVQDVYGMCRSAWKTTLTLP